MTIPLPIQSEFLSIQIQEAAEEYESYVTSPVANLRSEYRLFVGRIFAMDTQGNVILRFKKNECPRLKIPYEFLVYDSEKAGKAVTWKWSLLEFKQRFIQRVSAVDPTYFLSKDDAEYRYIGCRGLDLETSNWIKGLLEKGIHPPILLTEPPPPFEYFKNLQKFIAQNEEDAILNIAAEKGLDDWNPTLLGPELPENKSIILQQLEENGKAIVQGPPGTGKTLLVSEIISHYALAGKNVVVAALANKALIEVAHKEPLKPLLAKQRIWKTRLTSNESNSIKDLKNATELNCPKGHILLSTYFKLSAAIANPEIPGSDFVPPYDLLVIEEASQAFLATIAGFCKLAHKILIVGDPAQLPPIVKGVDKIEKLHPRIMSFANGLETLVANTNFPGYSLTATYRLTTAAAGLTSVFYKGHLHSQRAAYVLKVETALVNKYFSPFGGTTILHLRTDKNAEAQAIQQIQNLVADLLKDHNKREIAVLAPTRKMVRNLQNHLRYWSEQVTNLTIETVDRIQGLTVDYCIYYIAEGSWFAFEPKRFNVATSRAKCGTLIVANELYIKHGTSGLVAKYLADCEEVYD